MAINSEIVNTAERLQAASRGIAKVWDGRASVLEMKDADYPNWRQTEWIGAYFQYLCENTFAQILEMPGKRYGSAEFDAFGNISWVFKSHALNSNFDTIIVTDADAVNQTLDEYGCYGLILAIGNVEYSEEAKVRFKKWHDGLTGGTSANPANKIARDALSRTSVTAFTLSGMYFICLDDDSLNQCKGIFQKGFRNSNNPRKATVNVSRIPHTAILGVEKF